MVPEGFSVAIVEQDRDFAMTSIELKPRKIMVLMIDNSRSCAGKRPSSNMLWFCSREFIALKGITKHIS
jgi:hypothetical protein